MLSLCELYLTRFQTPSKIHFRFLDLSSVSDILCQNYESLLLIDFLFDRHFVNPLFISTQMNHTRLLLEICQGLRFVLVWSFDFYLRTTENWFFHIGLLCPRIWELCLGIMTTLSLYHFQDKYMEILLSKCRHSICIEKAEMAFHLPNSSRNWENFWIFHCQNHVIHLLWTNIS